MRPCSASIPILLQLRILRLGLFQERNIRVGIFPKREEILILPNPVQNGIKSYVPHNMLAIGDLFDLFDFKKTLKQEGYFLKVVRDTRITGV